MRDDVYKQCPKCGFVWEERSDFLADASVHVVGYQVNFEELKAGLFFFNHDVADCGTTISLRADSFVDLYAGPMFEEQLKDSDLCDGHCLRADDIEDCNVPCECAYVRHVLQVIRGWEKTPMAADA